jgi:hypothetical protein
MSRGVIEALLVVVSVAALSAGAWAWTSVPAPALLAAGAWLVAGGLAFGLPTGVVYHLALRRSLLALGALPRRWWLRPLALHPHLPADDEPRVLLWCRLGALGCAIAFLGCAVFALGAFRLLVAR